jgi:hypothetical protein
MTFHLDSRLVVTCVWLVASELEHWAVGANGISKRKQRNVLNVSRLCLQLQASKFHPVQGLTVCGEGKTIILYPASGRVGQVAGLSG